MLPTELLWGILPDPLPAAGPRRFGWIRGPVGAVTVKAALSRLPLDELVRRRVRRAAVQALVREAYQAALTEQDSEHRGPGQFAQAWHDHLARVLGQDSADVPGWGEVRIAEIDTGLAWELYEAARYARQHAIECARPTASRRVQWGGLQVETFQFAISCEGETLGEVRYGICPSCGTGLLYKISFGPDWQFCGLGRLALRQLEARHPELAWYTTTQYGHARGFYDRYRQDSDSPWTDKQLPCPHFDLSRLNRRPAPSD